jgi:putative transposase
MSRKVRLQYENALYHVINRGNYRLDIFSTEGAKRAFEHCLFEACTKAEWKLHAFVIMSNHYHFAIETPQANLVEGMQWLQSTFANRFNRFRRENGHVFQGRYKAIIVEDYDGMGAVAHYIHLNPVRAKLTGVDTLSNYRFSSYAYLNRKRPDFLELAHCLQAAGGLNDTKRGHQSYKAFLDWLAEDETMQKELKFDSMCRGWALGSKDFKRALITEHKEELSSMDLGENEVRELRELSWEKLSAARQQQLETWGLVLDLKCKSAPWKIALAAFLKTFSTASNPWIASRLGIGHPDALSRYVAEMRAGRRPDAQAIFKRISESRV